MKESAASPTMEGFRVMFARPAFGLAEITWRWCFGLAAWLLGLLSVAVFLDTVTVSRVDSLLLKSKQPALVAHALSDISRGSGARLVFGFAVLGIALAVLWMVTAALGRAATVKALVGHFRSVATADGTRATPRCRMQSMVGLHFFRAMAFLAALVACFAPFAVMRASGAGLDDGSVMLAGFAGTLLIGWAWSGVNWFLSLAAVFVVCRGGDTFGAMGAAIDLCRERPGSVFAIGTWFGLSHVGAFAVATFLAMFAMGLFGALPIGVGLIALLLVTLFYFAVADFLYIGRLAAYVALIEMPEMPASQPVPPAPRNNSGAGFLSNAIDRDELILSDLPASV
ncbi:MAG TPA: hypothetical protein VF753_06910 [Terriglobales bacterium]